jgi:glycosyltransferase EpsD
MKKVLFTSHVANFAKFNYPFMRWFKERGYEVHYASMGEEKIDCDRHFTVPFERSPFKLNNLRAIKQLKEIIDNEGYDIIHTHTPMGSVVTRIAAMAARKNGTRVIYTAHGFHFFKGAPVLNWLIYYPIEKLMAGYTDTLVTINKEDYEFAVRKFNTNVEYVPGVGIDPEKFVFKMLASEKLSLRRSLGLKKTDFVMLYTAELNKNKNQAMLIDAMERLTVNYPDMHLLLAGGDSLNGRLQRVVEGKKLTNNVHFLGYRKDIPRLLKISNVSVSTSLREGLPVNIMEAMYVGVPTIATNCRGNRDLVDDSKTGYLVDPNASDVLIEKISLLYDDTTLRYRLGKDSVSKVKETYLLNPILNEMGNIYENRPRVLHLLGSSKFSGAESVASELIKDVSNSYEAYYCSPSGDINRSLELRGIIHIPINRLSITEISRIVRLHRPDIIHAHDFKASIVASLFHKKVLIISHIHQNPAWLNKLNIKSFLYKFRLNTFSKVLLVTEEIKNNKIFNDVLTNRLIVAHNKVDEIDILRRAGSGVESQFDLGFCGRLEYIKQPFDFIQMVAEIKRTKRNVRAVIIGDGTLVTECHNLIEELDLQDNIRLVGFQDNPFRYIKSCKFLVITSAAEGFGLVAIEAMILKSVVISYDIPSIREVIGKNSDTFGDTMRELVDVYFKYENDRNLYNKQILTNLKNTKRFTKNAQAENDGIGAVYRDVLSESRNG